MTDLDTLRVDTIDGLDALGERGTLAARAEARRISLIEKLGTPVRIGLFGLPGSGKRALLTALTDVSVEASSGPSPTLEISHGSKAKTLAVLADGSRLNATGLPTASLMGQHPVFLQVTSPAAGLVGRRFLMVTAEAGADDLLAGLQWAAPRVDLALWCTTGWSEVEHHVWTSAPDSLRNHAVLVTTGGAEAGLDMALAGFDAQFSIADPALADGSAPLRSYLKKTIEEACLHDIHAAHLFLERYGISAGDRSGKSKGIPTPSAAMAEAAIIPLPVDQPTKQPVPAEAAAELARLFQEVRDSAQSLMRRVHGGEVGTVETLLTDFETVFETLAERTSGFESLQDTWPDLATQVTEAHDLALLLRIEGGAEQLGDAARLLLQVRYDIEERLAA